MYIFLPPKKGNTNNQIQFYIFIYDVYFSFFPFSSTSSYSCCRILRLFSISSISFPSTFFSCFYFFSCRQYKTFLLCSVRCIYLFYFHYFFVLFGFFSSNMSNTVSFCIYRLSYKWVTKNLNSIKLLDHDYKIINELFSILSVRYTTITILRRNQNLYTV